MMQFFLVLILLIGAYLLGSIPFGLVIVRLVTGKDIRQVESGRTGGTNAMRAAGFWAGLFTAFLDLLKGATAAWAARYIFPELYLVHVLAPFLAVLGHNYSIFLLERNDKGRLRLRGGAGGAPTAGGATGLWFPTILFILPIAAVILYFIGYASIATLSAPLIAIVVFAYRAWTGAGPWEYVLYGVLTEILLVIALRSNISRLLNGTERVIGLRARRKKQEGEKNNGGTQGTMKNPNHSSSSSSSSSS
jgi:acyl phosphate:glycerol-3-phosphate acyltransferase